MDNILIDKENNKYQPSTEIMNTYWLRMKKRTTSVKYSGFKLRGLYGTYSYGLMSFLMGILLLLEIYGLANLWEVLPNENYFKAQPFATGFILYLLFYFLIDLMLVFIAHLPQPMYIKAINIKKIIEHTGMPYETINYKNEIKSCKIKILYYHVISKLFYACILFMTILKISSFITHVSEEDTPSIIIIVISAIYAVIATIHILFTGNWIYEFIFRRIVTTGQNEIKKYEEKMKKYPQLNEAWNKQKNEILRKAKDLDYSPKLPPEPKKPMINSDNYITDFYNFTLCKSNDNVFFKDVSIVNKKHRIHTYNNNGIKEQKLEIWGILEDETLISFISDQDTDDQKLQLAAKGLKCQLELLRTPIRRIQLNVNNANVIDRINQTISNNNKIGINDIQDLIDYITTLTGNDRQLNNNEEIKKIIDSLKDLKKVNLQENENIDTLKNNLIQLNEIIVKLNTL